MTQSEPVPGANTAPRSPPMPTYASAGSGCAACTLDCATATCASMLVAVLYTTTFASSWTTSGSTSLLESTAGAMSTDWISALSRPTGDAGVALAGAPDPAVVQFVLRRVIVVGSDRQRDSSGEQRDDDAQRDVSPAMLRQQAAIHSGSAPVDSGPTERAGVRPAPTDWTWGSSPPRGRHRPARRPTCHRRRSVRAVPPGRVPWA